MLMCGGNMTLCRDGKLNAVVFWYKLQLAPDITLSTAPGSMGSGHLHQRCSMHAGIA